MDSVLVTAKNIELAIKEGLELLNTTIENVDVNIISEGGLFKKAKVELVLTEEAILEKSKREEKIKKLEEKADIKVKDVNIKNLNKNKENDIESQLNDELTSENLDKENIKTVKNVKTDIKVVENEITKFLQGLIYVFNINAEVKIENNNNEFNVKIEGENLGVLIGYHGSSLEAINYLLNNYIYNKFNENYKIMLDIENYRSKRAEILKSMAETIAKRVVETKRNYKLEPMSSFERKIIHSHLQNSEHISTHSEGKEPKRYLIINYVA